ncbi:thiamine pyrophosphate-binding protein [Acrocarpospora macrocephala]|uniref:Acetolactate synthase I/II/III large subunit n=1 Tax=Acrocarpospora macrocephala TaxID=150177 RepID=A0A5M3WL67_9ACTN|nr:thiamine pyrophosphate-binding protein [Acrocarpospora macrocephala]GES09396.1 acetolactate synthase I/II/III large subunit [Acrocarpospora macrocephala]
MTKKNAGAAMVEAMAAHGVRRCYTVPGESFLPLLEAADNHDEIQLISTRHESGASFMAEADARLTGAPAVAMATRGPGACNLSIGVHTAHEGSTAMLVVLGDVETDLSYRGAFQEVDLATMYAPITKMALRATRGDRLDELTSYALRVATSGCPGPVAITVPQDVLDAEFATISSLPVPATSPGAPDPESMSALAARLRQAHAPVAIVGEGAVACRDDLVGFAAEFGVGVYTGFRRQDAFPNNHPNYLGHLGLAPVPSTLAALRSADVVLVLGTRLTEVTSQRFTLPAPTSYVCQVDTEPATLAAHAALDLAVVADVGQTVRALRRLGGPATPRDWDVERSAFVASTRPAPSRASVGLDPVEVVATMTAVLPRDTIVASDAGNFAASLHRFWTFDHPRSQLAPTNGAMGYAVPAGVAGALATTGRHVISVVGDGGFLMTGQEIETAVRENLSLTVLVMRNGLHGTIAMHQALRGVKPAATAIGDVDLSQYARAFGARGIRVDDGGALADALRLGHHEGGVTIIDAVLDPDLITPAARLSELRDLRAS